METAAKFTHGPRQTDRVIEALATLAALIDRSISEVKSLDKDFQDRILQAVHDTEESLQSQAAEQVERARDEVREGLTRTLQAEFQAERERLNQEARIAAEASSRDKERAKDLVQEEVQAARREVSDELTRNFKRDLQVSLEALKGEFQTERERLNQETRNAAEASSRDKERARDEVQVEIQTARQEVSDELTRNFKRDLQGSLEALKGDFQAERERLNKELHHAVEAASRLESERSGLIGEMERIKNEAHVEIEKARAEAKAAVAAAPAAKGSDTPPESVKEEIARSEVRLKEILKAIDDPATQLSAVIRKNVEKSEVEAYLRGIRYALNGGAK